MSGNGASGSLTGKVPAMSAHFRRSTVLRIVTTAVTLCRRLMGICDLGPSAYSWSIAPMTAGHSLWQALPLGLLLRNAPYQRCRRSPNAMLIIPGRLRR